ncbi:MAG: four helix bundle protein [Acidobacteriota bacterium]
MNTTKPITSHPQSNNNLHALELALQAAGTAIALVDRVPTKLKSLQDQVIRSASSVPANIAEGHGRAGRDRSYHYRIAYGSAKEIDVHLRILAGANAIDRLETEAVLELFDQVRAMLWRLMHPQR